MSEEPEFVSVRVNIYDRDYILRTQGDPEQLRAVCADLDKRMREVAASTGTVDTFKVAVLAAISLSHDLHRSREELHRFDDSIGKRSLACVTMLDRIFK
jgi:cell division protein ZapA (FtsZ GTPase activity inhibitor)